jgi:hypothetical protein
VAHKVEASHEKHHVGENEPVVLERNLSFPDKGVGHSGSRFAQLLSLKEDLRLGQAKPEQNDQNWRTGAKPVQLEGNLISLVFQVWDCRYLLDANRGWWY